MGMKNTPPKEPAKSHQTKDVSALCGASCSSSFVRMFKPQFAGLVERGEKLQTVRPVPKRMPNPGDKISLRAWTGKPYRSKQRVLMDSTITRVRKIKITARGFDHWEEEGLGKRRNPDSLDAFARRDGFTDWSALVQWFRETHGLPFVGIVIHWQNAELRDRHLKKTPPEKETAQ